MVNRYRQKNHERLILEKVEDSFYDIKDAVGVEVVGLSFHNLIDVDDLNYRYVKSKNVTLL